ncbi:hypothetical protein [Lactococcus formosensis]|uniref:hypothetical protein n=1 Tax=Lactococcus formosensis TaxID=1281486 RepID=UPI0031FE5292
MLEYNLYDNFNPNIYARSSSTPSNTPNLPDPKARGVIMNYELWQTGYKYTSSGTVSTDVEVGDILEVLHPEEFLVPYNPTDVFNKKLSMFYLITSKDDGNKVTLKNYVWAMIEGVEIPTTALKQTNQQIIVNMMSPAVTSLVTHGYATNPDLLNIPVKWNRKSETDEMVDIAKDLFRVLRLQPSVYYQDLMVSRPDGTLEPVDNNLYMALCGREWNRVEKSIRVDFKQNITIEHEVITERSNYNYLNAYVKKADGTYDSYGQQFTINDKNEVVNMFTYRGDGHELPKQRLIKSVFYDEAPSNGDIKSQITKDSTVINLFFNQHPLLKLSVNDLVHIWYEDKDYHGYIADRVFTEAEGGVTNDRLLFVEGLKE